MRGRGLTGHVGMVAKRAHVGLGEPPIGFLAVQDAPFPCASSKYSHWAVACRGGNPRQVCESVRTVLADGAVSDGAPRHNLFSSTRTRADTCAPTVSRQRTAARKGRSMK